MAKQRSPNCPHIGFTQAAEKGRTVYQKEHGHPAAKSVIATDLGYSTLNGSSLTMIGALRQYGILEGSGEAMRVSEDAIAYFELDDGEEKRAAAQRMAFRPALFAEMQQQFGNVIPSDGNLRHWLVKRGFLPNTAGEIIRVYRENIGLFFGGESAYSEGAQKPEERHIPMQAAAQIAPTRTPDPGGIGPAVQTFSFPLSPEGRAELSLRGRIGPDDLELLRQHIELTIRALSRQAAPEVKPE